MNSLCRSRPYLILVPTPLDEEGQLESGACNLLQHLVETAGEKLLILVEDIKNIRQKWLRWGLPRAGIELFRSYSEHHQAEALKELQKLPVKDWPWVVLMCEQGLPAFADPGSELVDFYHQKKMPVTCTDFPHAVSLSLSLSGFSFKQFTYLGFPPHRDEEARRDFFKRIAKSPRETFVVMDTPYRLKKVVQDLLPCCELFSSEKRRIFFAFDLNTDREELVRLKANELTQQMTAFQDKREFVLVIEGRE